MARKAKKQKFNLLKIVSRILILAGKPLYLILNSMIRIIELLIRFKPNVKIKLPNLRLQNLKLSLFELKILSKIKKSKFKLKFKLRLKLIVPVILVILFILSFYFLIFRGLPSPKDLGGRTPEVSTKIYDRNGALLYKIYKNKNRTIVSLSQIPQEVRLSTLAAEDAEFYDHPGFSIKGIIRAFFANIHGESTQGGSTITQQLVKNVLLTPERTITRKIKEIILSVEVEREYSKDQILEMYLNEVSYGGTAYGIEEASETYFGKKVGSLNLAEAAFLAGIPQSPTLFSPFGPNPDMAIERQREVLHLMVVNKFITKSQQEEALNERLTFIANRKEIKAPHFVMYVRQLLVDKYGEDMVEKGGLEVKTSLDISIQNMAEEIVGGEVTKLQGLHVGNGAALVVNPQTGEILAMVGSKDYFDIKHDGNVNVTTRLRQPGSSIKIVNYAYALSNGYTPASVIDDSPITYVTPGSPPYSPNNYDGKFIGPVTLRSALAQSRNIPAVKVLASYGVAKMVEEGKLMGITTWENSSNYGLSLTLGGGAVKAIDLAKVFSTLANYGKRPDFLPILEVKDYKNRILESNIPSNTQVLDPKVAFSLIDILKDNNARAPEFGFNSYLVIKNHPEVAVKTGTSNDLRDNWTVGFNQNYLVLTWVGNNNNSPMSRIASGVTGASPIWNKIMSTILIDKTSVDWKAPEGMIRINCLGRGEWFTEGKVPANYCKPQPSPNPIDPNKILDGASTTNH